MSVHPDVQREKAAEKKAASAPVPHRRGLLRAVFGSVMGLGFAALGFVGALWAAITARFMMPNALAEPPSRFKVGTPGDYPVGYVETRFKEKHGVWIVHGEYRGRREIYALSTTCTHLGCITLWHETEQKFKCPCHGSGFTVDGINREGPAPRPLERFAIRVAEDGRLEVDRSRTFQEELGQWDDPACYVLT
jgi:cytochrome b6-f complex iron-sulfur subunit